MLLLFPARFWSSGQQEEHFEHQYSGPLCFLTIQSTNNEYYVQDLVLERQVSEECA